MIWGSLRIAILSSGFAVVLGVWLARLLAIREFRGKRSLARAGWFSLLVPAPVLSSRNSSLLETARFFLAGPYLPGHFRGDRVSIAIDPARACALSAAEAKAGAVPVELLRASQRTSFVRLEFSGGVFADVSREEYERRKDNRDWRVDFPPEALRIL